MSARLLFLLIFTTIASLAHGQSNAPVIISPEVAADHRVIFRLQMPNAAAVTMGLEGSKAAPMQKDDHGIWTITVGPLDPDFYGYAFTADGVTLTDPSNSLTKPNFIYRNSIVHVPGPPTLPWEENDVPHGEVHHHFYHSGIVGDQRDYYVYTPPGYDSRRKTKYPVLYLLHGYSDDSSAWTAVGRANVILDNLIAQGKARPMLVVMPFGYGAPEMLSHGPGGLDDYPSLRHLNYERFRATLLTEVIPRVENEYRVLPDRESRAIAGLSMGGTESLYTGLNNIEKFAWVGAFSSGGLDSDFDTNLPSLNVGANAHIRLLWIACGTDDGYFKINHSLREWLTSKGVNYTDIDTPGAHTWMVWRRNLADFAPLLFR